MKTNCYKCKHKRNIPGDMHIMCMNPDPDMKGKKHGIINGWFIYPHNFDPIWMDKDCARFEEKK